MTTTTPAAAPETVTQAVARKDNSPAALIRQYSTDFATVLPSHVKPDTWVRLAQGALKKGKREKGSALTDLEIAAANNPGVFLATLLDAARLGLEPGTEQYYLTPRKVKGGRSEILGIIGYQGHIELMYRAGAVTSVIAEVVYGNDKFSYQPGRDEVPQHEIDWDSTDRGPLRLVYAYARMGESVSRVIVLNKTDIARIKASSQGADSEYSPWRLHEASMWLKSAVRQLQKWVPTSAEYRREIARASAEAQRVAQERAPDAPPVPSGVDPDDFIEGQVVDEGAGDWPATTPPGGEA